MRTFGLTLTIGLVFGISGAASAVHAEDSGVAQCGDHACPCPPPQLISETPKTCKVCVSVPKPQTKVVYSSVCKEYCLPKCTLRCLFHHGCDGCGDGCDNCGKVAHRHVLIKKIVPDCDTHECVLRETLAPQCQPAPACGYLPPATKCEPLPTTPAPAK